MAEDKILDAIKNVSNSVTAMESRMKSFSTKDDIAGMVGELEEVKERVFVNSHNIEKLFDMRKTDQDNLLKKVEQIVDSRMNDDGNRRTSRVSGGPNVEHQTQYLLCRRSMRIWPVSEVNELDKSVRDFFKRYLKISDNVVDDFDFEQLKRLAQPRRSKIHKEVLVRFRNAQARDVAQSYALNLAESAGNAGLRLEVPDHLRGLFRRFETHGAALRNKYGSVKRAVRFDDENMSLTMDVKLENTQWHRLSAQDVLSQATPTIKPASTTLVDERKKVLLQDVGEQEDEEDE